MLVSPKQIEFIFFDAGGGHRAAATALQSVIEQQGYPWSAQLMNFQTVLDPIDLFRKYLGIRLQDVYNLILKKGWTLGSPQGVQIMHWLIQKHHPHQVAMLKEYWKSRKPDLVVSVIPNFAKALYESLKAVHPGVPLVTILTDMADYPPHFWMEPGQKQYWICGTAKAVEQAKRMGYGHEQIIPVSGMIVNPKFYQPIEMDRAAERSRLGLDPERPTGLILFGGQGSPVMETILAKVEGANLNTQYIAICGKNERLHDKLGLRHWKMPTFVEGFTKDVPYYMKLSDFFIGKPGPGSISEAMLMGLPVIVESNAWTLPQERYNAEWVLENKVGMVLRNFRGIGGAVQELIMGRNLAQYQANASKLNNRAVFEIPPILEQLMQR